VIAVATDVPVKPEPLRRLDLNNTKAIGDFILTWMEENTP
jgi:hypothetical protein